jgi:glycerol-3-phosphate dehydrogenase
MNKILRGRVAPLFLASTILHMDSGPRAALCSDDTRTIPAAAKSVDKVYDVAVIGAGVVGLAVARECAATHGASVIVLEKEDSVGAGASSGNSGLGCTGYDAPVGSLERQLLRRSIRLHQHLYRSFGLSHQHVRKCGSLVVAWTPEELAKLPAVLAENKEAGDADAALLSQAELRDLEPALSRQALGAVHCPNEAVVEPWLVPVGYARACRAAGVNITTGAVVTGVQLDRARRQWSLTVAHSADAASGRSWHTGPPGDVTAAHSVPASLLATHPNQCPPVASASPAPPKIVRARVVVNCAGLHGGHLERLRAAAAGPTLPEPPLEITPRKGQFVVFEDPEVWADRGQVLGQGPPLQSIIEPVATEFTKGVIVWRTVYGNVVVGPTAVDQACAADRSTDAATAERLAAYGRRVVPALRGARVVGTYSGLRPASQHRDYQIYIPTEAAAGPAERAAERAAGQQSWLSGRHRHRHQQWVTVGGIRSTGLTASSAIGEYAGLLYRQLRDDMAAEGDPNPNPNLGACHFNAPRPAPDAIDLDDSSRAPDGLLSVTAAARNPRPLPVQHLQQQCLPHFPSLEELAGQYQQARRECAVNVDGAVAVRLAFDDPVDTSGGFQLQGATSSCSYRVTHPISSFGMESLAAADSRQR